MDNPVLTADRLRQVLSYNSETGIFTRKLTTWAYHKSGAIAGSKSHEYTKIFVDGKIYKASRLAWLYVTGEWPSRFVDHKDGNKKNDRFDNLRLATAQENTMNRGIAKSNKCGFKGVYKVGNRWRAEARINRKKVHIGYFDTPEEASRAYDKKARELFGEFYRSSIAA